MYNRPQGGFIQLIIILIIVLIVLGYFGFNIQQIIQSPSVSGNLNYVWGLAVNLWSNYLIVPVTFVWLNTPIEKSVLESSVLLW